MLFSLRQFARHLARAETRMDEMALTVTTKATTKLVTKTGTGTTGA